MPKISVIMSVRNNEKTIERAIRSIQDQTFADWEFLIVDDCSNDSTYTVLERMAKCDKRIKLFKNETNLGLAASLDFLISKSRCNILARQDADDYSDKERFEKQYAFVCSHPNFAIVGTNWFNVDSSGEMHPAVGREIMKARKMVWDGGFMHPSWMMRKDMLEKVGFYTVNEHTRRDQDYHLMMKVLGAGMQCATLQEFLYYYVADDNTFKRTKDWKGVKHLMWIRRDGFKRNHLPFWDYIFVLKPFVKNLVPVWLSRWYYNKRNNQK
jgi:glycosyltransferase EpsE